jgi:hypothetical protein
MDNLGKRDPNNPGLTYQELIRCVDAGRVTVVDQTNGGPGGNDHDLLPGLLEQAVATVEQLNTVIVDNPRRSLSGQAQSTGLCGEAGRLCRSGAGK